MIVDNKGNVLERNDFYPFGVKMTRANYPVSANNQFLFSGKEALEEYDGWGTKGKGSYDFGARIYYSPFGRFDIMDPLAHLHFNTSPYAFCGNNPVNRVDPDGRNWYNNGNDVSWVNEDDEQMKRQVEGWEDLGEKYMGISISMKPTYNHFCRELGDGRNHVSGMEIEISYDGGETGAQYGWTQIIRANPAIPRTPKGYEKGAEFVDFYESHEYHYPLYYSEFSANNTRLYDRPERYTNGTHQFNAESSLLKRTYNYGVPYSVSRIPTNSTVITLEWGFSVQNGVRTINPVRVVQPSPFMQQTINTINRTK